MRGQRGPRLIIFITVKVRGKTSSERVAAHFLMSSFQLLLQSLIRESILCRRSNQFILKEINPENSLEGLMLKRKLQYFGHLMRRSDSLEKTLMLERLRAGGGGVGDRG